MIFLDLGTNNFQGLEEFTNKLNLSSDNIIYSFEPSPTIYSQSKNKYDSIKNNYKVLHHINKAVLDYTGTILFNDHHGVWAGATYIKEYNAGSNCLEINPKIDRNNGVIFDIHQVVVDCIDINDVIKNIVNDNNLILEKSIIIKCDVEGSEFKVLPKLLTSDYLKYIKEVYIEWHERFFIDNKIEYNNVCNIKKMLLIYYILITLVIMNIINFKLNRIFNLKL